MNDVLRISSGVIVWAAHFALLYGVTALACARGQPRVATWVIAIATLAGVSITGVIVASAYPRREHFGQWLTAAVAAVAAVAMVWEAVAGLLAGSCE